jgi:hypothetical protein
MDSGEVDNYGDMKFDNAKFLKYLGESGISYRYIQSVKDLLNQDYSQDLEDQNQDQDQDQIQADSEKQLASEEAVA